MKGLSIINLGLITVLAIAGMDIRSDNIIKYEALLQIMAEYELKVEEKTPLIKFYTIPGYNCDTTEWKGHCSNLNMSQAEYDKKNSNLFNVTHTTKGN